MGLIYTLMTVYHRCQSLTLSSNNKSICILPLYVEIKINTAFNIFKIYTMLFNRVFLLVK